MPQTQPPRTLSARVEGRDENSKTPMERFKERAQRLMLVSKQELAEAEREYEERRNGRNEKENPK